MKNSFGDYYSQYEKILKSIGEIPLPIIILFCVIFLIFYVINSYLLFRIAKKANADFAPLAFIPLADNLLMLSIADLPFWWAVLLLIPFPVVSVIWYIVIWAKIADNLKKPFGIGILAMPLLPLINILPRIYLAFSKD